MFGFSKALLMSVLVLSTALSAPAFAEVSEADGAPIGTMKASTTQEHWRGLGAMAQDRVDPKVRTLDSRAAREQQIFDRESDARKLDYSK